MSMHTETSGQGTSYKPSPPNRWTRNALSSLTPERLASIIVRMQLGDFEAASDLASYMLRVDPHVRSTYMTRINAVAGAEIQFEPATDGDPELAQRACDFARSLVMDCDGLRDRLADLLHAMGLGVAVLEHDFRYESGIIKSTPRFVHPRDVRYVDSWHPEIRTYDGYIPTWIQTKSMAHQNKFIVHTPHQIADVPTFSGELHAVMWPFLFKRWLEKYQANALEKLGGGFLYGLIPDSASPVARTAMREGLDSLQNDMVAVFNIVASSGIADPVRFLEPTNKPGESFRDGLAYYNAEISKAILGSGLNVEVASTGGNRSLGESQFSTTILPRLVFDAMRLAETIREQWVKVLLGFNVHVFGGRMPPVPRINIIVINDEQQEIVVDEIAINAGVVEVDELRRSRGLKPFGGDRGKQIVQPMLPSVAPMNESGGSATLPFSRSLATTKSPMHRLSSVPSTPTAATSHSRGVSPTSSRSMMTPIELALLRGSEDRSQ